MWVLSLFLSLCAKLEDPLSRAQLTASNYTNGAAFTILFVCLLIVVVIITIIISIICWCCMCCQGFSACSFEADSCIR